MNGRRTRRSFRAEDTSAELIAALMAADYSALPASGMEAPSGGETVQQGSTEDDSPTAESDAQ